MLDFQVFCSTAFRCYFRLLMLSPHRQAGPDGTAQVLYAVLGSPDLHSLLAGPRPALPHQHQRGVCFRPSLSPAPPGNTCSTQCPVGSVLLSPPLHGPGPSETGQGRRSPVKTEMCPGDSLPARRRPRAPLGVTQAHTAGPRSRVGVQGRQTCQLRQQERADHPSALILSWGWRRKTLAWSSPTLQTRPCLW